MSKDRGSYRKHYQNIIMDELLKVVKPLDIKVVELFVKENKSGLSINVIIEKDGGITIDDCERVTRLLNDRLSILDELEVYNYRLQVSSPGLYRVFKSRKEYDIFKFREVKVILKEPLELSAEEISDNDKNKESKTIYEGTLLGIEDNIVRLKDCNNKIIEIPFNKIKKTKLNG